jgi:hypothetical protein
MIPMPMRCRLEKQQCGRQELLHLQSLGKLPKCLLLVKKKKVEECKTQITYLSKKGCHRMSRWIHVSKKVWHSTNTCI